MNQGNQRIQLTKRLLKEALLDLIKQKDLDKISVTELCRHAGINRATFYRHYQIPRDVLMEIQTDLYKEIVTGFSLPKTTDDLKPVFLHFCHYIEENSSLVQVLLFNNSETTFALFLNEIIEDIWQDLTEREESLALSREEIQLMLWYVSGGSYFLLRRWLQGNIRKNADEMAEYLYTLVMKTEHLITRSKVN